MTMTGAEIGSFFLNNHVYFFHKRKLTYHAKPLASKTVARGQDIAP